MRTKSPILFAVDLASVFRRPEKLLSVNMIHHRKIVKDVAVVVKIEMLELIDGVRMILGIAVKGVIRPTIVVIVVVVAAVIVVTLTEIQNAHVHLNGHAVMLPQNVCRSAYVNTPRIVHDDMKVAVWKRSKSTPGHGQSNVKVNPRSILRLGDVAPRHLAPEHRVEEVWNAVKYQDERNQDQKLPS